MRYGWRIQRKSAFALLVPMNQRIHAEPADWGVR